MGRAELLGLLGTDQLGGSLVQAGAIGNDHHDNPLMEVSLGPFAASQLHRRGRKRMELKNFPED